MPRMALVRVGSVTMANMALMMVASWAISVMGSWPVPGAGRVFAVMAFSWGKSSVGRSGRTCQTTSDGTWFLWQTQLGYTEKRSDT
jgi:hypothetical protein